MKENNLSPDQVVKSGVAENVCQSVVEKLMNQDEPAITRLLRSLLSVSPSLQIHQLEGIFSYLDEGISAEIIDFDGIDSLDAARSCFGGEMLPALRPKERLLRGQLTLNGILISDPIALRDLYLLRQKADVVKAAVAKTDFLLKEVKESAIQPPRLLKWNVRNKNNWSNKIRKVVKKLKSRLGYYRCSRNE